jgi:hypothetical protein
MRAILLATIACLGWCSAHAQPVPTDRAETLCIVTASCPSFLSWGHPDSHPVQRAYTLAEIDRMRAILNQKIRIPEEILGCPLSYPCDGENQFAQAEAVRRTDVERQLRTYMQAGIGPAELEAVSHATSQQPVQAHP